MIKVENLNSPKTGKSVPNQFVITVKDRVLFQSYKTPIALTDEHDGIVFVCDKKYSRTTTKYTNEFLNQHKNYTVFYVTEEELEDRIRLCI